VSNEFGRSTNGVGNGVKGTKTIEFMPKYEVPQARRKDVMCGYFV
jgi:hypothetical protein